jgi:hypothetical protein
LDEAAGLSRDVVPDYPNDENANHDACGIIDGRLVCVGTCHDDAACDGWSQDVLVSLKPKTGAAMDWSRQADDENCSSPSADWRKEHCSGRYGWTWRRALGGAVAQVHAQSSGAHQDEQPMIAHVQRQATIIRRVLDECLSRPTQR